MNGRLGTYYAVNGGLTKEQRNANAEYICRYFVALGWSLQAICGMLGNMQQEAGINPGRWQGGIVKDSKGYGLVQWTPSTNLRSWAKANGLDELMDGQLARIQWELDNGKQFFSTKDYPITFRQFAVSTQSAYYLGRAFGRNYERSGAILAGGTAAEKSLNARGEAAEAWYAVLVGTPAADTAEAVNETPQKAAEPAAPIMDKALDYMRSKVGKRYDDHPDGINSFDCSLLTKQAAAQVGHNLSWGATMQWDEGFEKGYWANSGTLDTLPANESAFLFNRGVTSRGTIGMRHVAGYDGRSQHVVQAGGFNGTGVHENPFSKCRTHFTHWAILKEKSSENAPQEAQEKPDGALPTLRKGSEGAEVKRLQTLLNANDAVLEVDGKFGVLTLSAVRTYQSKHGLVVDGIVGKKTWAKLTDEQQG